MKRHFVIGATVLSVCALCAASAWAIGVAPAKLVAEKDANAAGLTRAWFAQATLQEVGDAATTVSLLDGTLFVTTESGFLQAFDSETGAELWNVYVGDGYLLAPGVNSKVVVVLSGTKMVILDRFNGKKLDEATLQGNPSSSPVVTEREVYVPLFSQRILSYPIVRAEQEALKVNATTELMRAAVKDSKAAEKEFNEKFDRFSDDLKNAQYLIEPMKEKQPYSCASLGTSLVRPVLGTQSYDLDVVGWTTNQGWLLIGGLYRRSDDDPFKLLYKLQARPNFVYVNESRIGNRSMIPRDDVESSPFFVAEDKSLQNMRLAPERRKGGMFIVGSQSGHVFAINDVTGQLRWTFLTEHGVSERIAAFDDSAYIPTESGEMFAVNLLNGTENWKADGLVRTIAASSSYLYAFDHLDRVAIIDRATGARVKTFDVGNTDFQVFNRETDRLYFASKSGLIQCFHETQQVEPLRHCETCADANARILAQQNKEDEAVKGKGEKKAPVIEEKTVPSANEAEVQTTTPATSGSNSSSDDSDPFGGEDEDDPFATEDEAQATAPATSGGNSSDDDSDPFGGEDEEDPFGGDF